jgi:hypothetical protein
MAHFAHYVRRTVVEVNYEDPSDPWFAENQPDNQGFDSPAYHVTRSLTGPAARVSEGDTIWLFSQLTTPWGVFPPALDAKIVVGGVSMRTRSFNKGLCVRRYEADKGSMWFPLYDATPCIRKLWTVDIKGRCQKMLKDQNQPIGQALQSMRELSDVRPLLELELKINIMPFDFISYRLIDGTSLAFDKAIELVQKKRKAIFWDRWSLPRRLAERREFLNDASLNSYIFEWIFRCNTLWAIQSTRYAEFGSYSACEKCLAERLGKLQIYP